MYSISLTLVSFSRACLVVAISILLGRLVVMDFLLQEARLGEPFIASLTRRGGASGAGAVWGEAASAQNASASTVPQSTRRNRLTSPAAAQLRSAVCAARSILSGWVSF